MCTRDLKALGEIQDRTRELVGCLNNFVQKYGTDVLLGKPLPMAAASDLASLWSYAGDLHLAVFDALVPTGRLAEPAGAPLTASP